MQHIVVLVVAILAIVSTGCVIETTPDIQCDPDEALTRNESGFACISLIPGNTPQRWEQIDGVPADLADGDNDTLEGLGSNCVSGSVPVWEGSSWTCRTITASGAVTADTIREIVSSAPMDLASGSSVNGEAISTGQHTIDTRLTEAEVETFVTNASLDLAGGSTLDGQMISIGQHTVDTRLSESEVENYVTNGALNLAAGTTLDGQPLMSSTTPIIPIGSGRLEVTATNMTPLPGGQMTIPAGTFDENGAIEAMVLVMSNGGDIQVELVVEGVSSSIITVNSGAVDPAIFKINVWGHPTQPDLGFIIIHGHNNQNTYFRTGNSANISGVTPFLERQLSFTLQAQTTPVVGQPGEIYWRAYGFNLR